MWLGGPEGSGGTPQGVYVTNIPHYRRGSRAFMQFKEQEREWRAVKESQGEI